MLCLLQASGEALYTGDIDMPAGGLHAAYVTSTEVGGGPLHRACLIMWHAGSVLQAAQHFAWLAAAQWRSGGLPLHWLST
jgi:hypothetical protein